MNHISTYCITPAHAYIYSYSYKYKYILNTKTQICIYIYTYIDRYPCTLQQINIDPAR